LFLKTVLLHPLAIYAPSVESVLDENTFLTDEPYSLMKNGGIVNKVPWLTGVNADDGLIYSASNNLTYTINIFLHCAHFKQFENPDQESYETED